MKFQLEDISFQTNHCVNSSVCRWKPEPSPVGCVVDSLSAVDAAGHLILFEQSFTGGWQSRNLSQLVDRLFMCIQPIHAKVAGTFIRSAGSPERTATRSDALILPDQHGHLVVCYRQQDTSWVMTDISTECEMKVDRASRPVVWEQSDGAVLSLHVLAVNEQGELVEFEQYAGQCWLCRVTGATAAPASLSVVCADTGIGQAVSDAQQTVFSVSNDGLLCRHVRTQSETLPWQHELISNRDLPRLRPHSTTVFSINDQCHVAACDVFGSVLVHRQIRTESGALEWNKTDVTAQTGCRVRSVDSAMVLSNEVPFEQSTLVGNAIGTAGFSTSVILTAQGKGRIYRFWWNEQEHWQVSDLEETVGVGTRLPAHAGLSDSSDESMALILDDRLVLCRGLEQLRYISKRLIGANAYSGYPVFSRCRTFLCRVDAWHDGRQPAPELRAVGEAVFGSRSLQRNAASYLDYASGGAFTLMREDVVGWLDVADVPTSKTDRSDPGSSKQASCTSEQARRRFQQAIHGEPSAGWVSAADSDGPGKGTEPGAQSQLLIMACHGRAPMLSKATQAVLWPVQDAISVVRLLQEILATCAHLPRLPHDAPEYDLMSIDPGSLDDSRFLHPNGAWKLLLGWVRPRVVTRSMRYELRAIADSREVIVLVRELSEQVEYFVIENRQRRPMDDIRAPGLLIWHVRQGTSGSSDAADVEHSGARWEVTLASAITDDAISCETLLWAGGCASGYTLNNVSASADVMSFDVGMCTDH